MGPAPFKTMCSRKFVERKMGKKTRCRSVARILIVLFMFAFFLLKAGGAGAAMHFVDDSGGETYTSIGAAIASAASGDTIIVRAGTYNEYGLNFSGKDLVLKSDSGAANTIIDCQNSGRAFIFQTGETSASVLKGFTIRNGTGAISIASASPTISHILFENNAISGSGGAIYLNNSSSKIVNCLFVGNSASSYGGALEIINCPNMYIYCCTFVQNSAAYGGAIDNDSSLTDIANSIFWGNTATSSGNQILNYDSDATLNITHSDIQGNLAGIVNNGTLNDGNGNIAVDPGFVSGTNFHLGGGSPCIDSGTIGYTYEFMDLDESYRRDNGYVDMGAYEYRIAETHTFASLGVSTIQGAINHYLVGGGDTVLVPSGVYSGTGNVNISFKGKDITLRSEQGPINTVIDGGFSNRGVVFNLGERNTSVLDGFTIRNCRTTADGAAVLIENSGPTIQNCRVENNFSEDHGGGIAINGATGFQPQIFDTDFLGNVGVTNGGAISIRGNQRVRFEGGAFEQNISGHDGGAVFVSSSTGATLEIWRMRLKNNRAGLRGGAIYTTGILHFWADNCLFYGNEASVGGAVQIENNDVLFAASHFHFCTFSANKASAIGGAINASAPGNVFIFNSIFWGNKASEGGGDQLNGNFTMLQMNNVDLEGGFESAGEGSFALLPLLSNVMDVDPLFSFADDLHLSPRSPCIDAGEQVSPYQTLDLEENPRLADGDGDSEAKVDLGAFEYTPGPSVSSQPQSIRFYYRPGEGFPDLQYLAIRNTAGTELDWRLESGETWLLAEPVEADASLASGAVQKIKVLVDPTVIEQLQSGTYQADLKLFDADSSSESPLFTLNVQLVVGKIWRVSAGQSIQTNIDAASDGDVVLVESGTFIDSLDYHGKKIVVRSESGPQTTIIDCTAATDFCISFESGEDRRSVFEGFTVQNAPFGAMAIRNFASPSVVNTVFNNNSSTSYGGGIYLQSQGAYIANCRFTGNSATLGGGIYMVQSASNTVVDSTFSSNTAQEGGGVHIRYGNSNLIQRCAFDQNIASDQSSITRGGGGISIYDSADDIIQACTFSDNNAYSSGGAILTSSSTMIVNSLFRYKNRSAYYGGAVYSPGDAKIINCTFVGNSSGIGGGVYGGSATTISNSLFYLNSATNGSPDYNGTPTVVASGSCGMGGDPEFPVLDGLFVKLDWVNYDADPDNDMPENDDFRLAPGSPCIDVGTDIFWLHSDIRGSMRPIDGGDGNGGVDPDGLAKMDIGAYEYSRYFGGAEGDQTAKPFMDLGIESSVILTGHEYQIEWKDRDPFPARDERIQQAGEYAVRLALIDEWGRRIDLLDEPQVMRTTPAGYAIPFTFDSTQLGEWRIRLEMAADPNQYVESGVIDISYQDVSPIEMGQAILPPEGVIGDQKPDVDVDAAVYWSASKKKLFAIKPTTVVITWYLDKERTQPVPTILHIVPPAVSQIHVAGSQPVDLLPGGTRFDSVNLLYTGSGATQSANRFEAQNEGFSVLLYRDDHAVSIDDSELIQVVQTVKWDHNLSVAGHQSLPEEKTWDIGKQIVDLCPEEEEPVCRGYHDSTCGSGYVFYEDGWYDGFGENRAYDRINREGPIFAVNRDLTGLMENSDVDPRDDLVVVWYEKEEETGVCWPFKPVRYDPQWPQNPENIVIASGFGSGPLMSGDFGLDENMHIYNQPDEQATGYNPNEEHAIFSSAPGGEHKAVFALRNDLNTYRDENLQWQGPLAGTSNQKETSAPYVLLKYKDPDQNNAWNFEVYRVVRQSRSFVREEGELVEFTDSGVPDQRSYIDKRGELQYDGNRYRLDSRGRIISPHTNNLRYNLVDGFAGKTIQPATRDSVLSHYIDSAGVLQEGDFPATGGSGFYIDAQGYLTDPADTAPVRYNFVAGVIQSVVQEDAETYFIDQRGQLLPAASYYLNPEGYLASMVGSEETRYDLVDGVVTEVPKESAVAYYINSSGELVSANTPSGDQEYYLQDKLGVLVERDIYYRFHYDAEAGQEINPFFPLREIAFGPCSESSTTTPDWVLQDKDDKFFARNGGFNGAGSVDVGLRYYYRLQPGFYYDRDGDGLQDTDTAIGTCIPLLDKGSGIPITTTFAVQWPDLVPTLYVGETLTEQKTQAGETVGLPNIADQCSAQVLFDQSVEESGRTVDAQGNFTTYSVNMYDPIAEYGTVLELTNPENELPQNLKPKMSLATGRFEFTALPKHLKLRLTYDPADESLKLKGHYEKITGEATLLPNFLSSRDIDTIQALIDDPAADTSEPTSRFRSALADLRFQGQRALAYPGHDVGVTPASGSFPERKLAEMKALTAGEAKGTGYVTLAFNNDQDCTAPTMLSVVRVGCPVYTGEIKVVESENPFEEKLTLRHNGDFGSMSDDHWFQWKYLPADFSGIPEGPDDPAYNWQNYFNVDAVDTGHIPADTPPEDLDPKNGSGNDNFFRGAVDITVQGTGLQLLPDKWFSVRYGFGYGDDAITTDCPCDDAISAWSPPQLYEGWIKRVMKKINPYDQKFKDFHQGDVNTLVSMISLAGKSATGDIALSESPEYLQSLGLIETYETLLKRGISLGGESTYSGDVDIALLFAANRLADLYMLLGNEAYSDATDPTIGFSTESGQVGAMASSLFSFQNQVDSLLDEELALLRGRDDKGVAPFYNRLAWNFTLGDGEVAYKENYNITDQDTVDTDGDRFPDAPNGEINELDAMIQYPQGHGDAWGYYLSAVKEYYGLLKNKYYQWTPKTENILVAGTPVGVDYRDERKFAAAAAAKARTGAEIVGLTYRQQYTEDPEGQWQGYKDVDPERAWGVDGWSKQTGQGAFLDWVMGNALLPTTYRSVESVVEASQLNGFDVSTINYDSREDQGVEVTVNGLVVGPDGYTFDGTSVHFAADLQIGDRLLVRAVPYNNLQRVDRSSVTELQEVALRYNEIQAEVDKADAGLNPLGLATAAIPFDIDPGRVAGGETHFEQIYQRAVDALNNGLAVFNYANQNSNMLRSQQDSFDDFQRNIDNMEADFNNRLVEVFGYPYPEDCGPGETYPTSYCTTGPDLFHYMYADPSELMGEKTPKVYELKVPVRSYFFDEHGLQIYSDGALVSVNNELTFHVTTDSRFGIIKPEGWSRRKAPGEIQLAHSDLLQNRGRFEKAILEYTNLIDQIEAQAEVLQAQKDLNLEDLVILNKEKSTRESLNASIKGAKDDAAEFRLMAKIAYYTGEAGAETLPKVLGLIAGMSTGSTTDPFASARAAFKYTALAITKLFEKQADDKISEANNQEQAKEYLAINTNIELTTARGEFAELQQLKQLESLVRSEPVLRYELYNLEESLKQSASRYLAALAKGERILADRHRFRTQTAAQVQSYRYKDMAFRIFRNDALQKYRAQFDMAARYVYLAAKAYDYETSLLDSDTRAGQSFLTDIVKRRSIGMMQGDQPLTGSGLADPMKRMYQNFQVLKSQLGFNNPQIETNRFSLRQELFRIRMDSNSNQHWRDTLAAHKVADLWTDPLYGPYFRRYCRPVGHEGISEPAIVIPFDSTVTSRLNFFGWPLGGGDSYYSATNFATKIRSVGVWFSNYNAVGLAQTPRVYLLPVGEDVLRSPHYYSREVRTWQVVDQKIPIPFPINETEMINDRGWIPTVDTIFDEMFQIRRHSDFRAYHDSGYLNQSEMQYDSRLIGRSVWNSKWLLIIPGSNLLYDPDEGLETFIYGPAVIGGSGERTGNGISDIKLFFETYGYSGN